MVNQAHEHVAALNLLCQQFVDAQRRIAELERLVPEDELQPCKQAQPPPLAPPPQQQPPPPPPPPPPQQPPAESSVAASVSGAPPPPAAPTPSQQHGHCCQNGHPLRRAAAGPTQLICDGCNKALRRNTTRWSCATCDFDLCSKCAGADSPRKTPRNSGNPPPAADAASGPRRTPMAGLSPATPPSPLERPSTSPHTRSKAQTPGMQPQPHPAAQSAPPDVAGRSSQAAEPAPPKPPADDGSPDFRTMRGEAVHVSAEAE